MRFLIILFLIPLFVNASNMEILKPFKQVISENAVNEITREYWPKTYAQWGEDGIEKINEYQVLAAISVSKQKSCPKVTYVDFSSRSNHMTEEMIFFVDCSNGDRFYISNTDIDNNSIVLSNIEISKIGNESALSKHCDSELKKNLTIPSSYSNSIGDTVFYRAKVSGNVVVTKIFSASNAFDKKSSYTGKCWYNANKFIESAIAEK